MHSWRRRPKRALGAPHPLARRLRREQKISGRALKHSENEERQLCTVNLTFQAFPPACMCLCRYVCMYVCIKAISASTRISHSRRACGHVLLFMFLKCTITANPRKLEHRFRMGGARIPYALP